LLPTADTIWFVEDRLPTLYSIVSQPDLADVELFLANWGYNTATERATANQDPTITLLSLNSFNQQEPEQW
jgi:hypothetical protein